MENASKFLLMAASVLLGVMILALGVYLFSIFGNYSSEINDKRDQQFLTEFNDSLLSFQGRNDITLHEIVSLANFAKENNMYYDVEEYRRGNYYLQISLANIGQNFEKATQDFYNEKLSEVTYHSDTETGKILPIILYKCKVDIDEITGRVYKMTFSQV